MASALADMMAGASRSGGGNNPAAAVAARGGAAAAAAGPSGEGEEDDDPLAQLFGRILGGMMPHGAALPGAPGGPAAGEDGPSAAPAAAAAGGGDDDALASSRLAGLAAQTRKTVSQQAKKTRGHVEIGAAAAAGRPGGAAGAAGGPFALLRELGGGLGGEAGGEGGEGPGVNMMVDYIMRHLLSKDVLYGPLKEIRDRYPPWLETHQGTLPAEEYSRYVAQYESVVRVCAHYESAPNDYSKLMELIQEMQTYGDPPGDIVEEMTDGAGRDINAILGRAEAEPAPTDATAAQPALDELSSELDKCKVQ
ncbi:hypothetical protein GPECTOR_5g343 [Gonium pectorale]|uniref:Peroxin-19 n=1 Tax=Gonium pectorale TaxID=33097 RepID=A0A150GWY8_GONPE|nr:hypothetical protein GPECTOR_5g343 [Gonium pectorale]|eukprot:KXZ54253.1 hypothetical protein GPECTOR_5g343 [Gonium pectorale]